MTTTAVKPDLLGSLLTRLTGDEKHAPSAYSTLNVLWVLYDRVLRLSPDAVDDPDRDRFLLSKGHGPAAYYAVLAAKGFFPVEWLDDFGGPRSRLGHPMSCPWWTVTDAGSATSPSSRRYPPSAAAAAPVAGSS